MSNTKFINTTPKTYHQSQSQNLLSFSSFIPYVEIKHHCFQSIIKVKKSRNHSRTTSPPSPACSGLTSPVSFNFDTSMEPILSSFNSNISIYFHTITCIDRCKRFLIGLPKPSPVALKVYFLQQQAS